VPNLAFCLPAIVRVNEDTKNVSPDPVIMALLLIAHTALFLTLSEVVALGLTALGAVGTVLSLKQRLESHPEWSKQLGTNKRTLFQIGRT